MTTNPQLTEVIEILNPEERAELEQLISQLAPWEPDPRNKPQCMACSSVADEILYGGAGGGGKTDSVLGLARTKHIRSLILRRNFPELERSVITRALEFFGGSYNSAKHVCQIGKQRIEFGHIERPGTPELQGDEKQYSSAAYDFIGVDQLEEFPEYPYLFMASRLRTSDSKQRTQIFATANWVGENLDWIVKRWGAWLGENPTAKPGELKWYYRLKGDQEEREAPNGDKIWDERALEWVKPKSRTFIPAGVKDNPYMGEDYIASLQSLPEPLRSALLYGDLSATRKDNAYQVLPRQWVKAAMRRWAPGHERPGIIPTVGVDVARGGDDKTVFAPKWDNWYAPLLVFPGRETPDGQSVVSLLVAQNLKAVYNIDVIGIGASVYDLAKTNMVANPINFGAGSDDTDESGLFTFMNMRAACYWKFRQALDPKNETQLAIQPDSELEEELCAIRWIPEGKTIRMQSKEEIKTKLGRSPDKADAIVLANALQAVDWETLRGLGHVEGIESRWT